MDNGIFRKKSMERMSSPEQLNDYIKVCRPSLWIVVAAAVILLSGAIVWGFIGHLDTTLNTVAICDNGCAAVYVKAANIKDVTGKRLTVNGAEYTITEDMCSEEPVPVDDSFSDYAMYIGELSRGEWVYTVTVDADMPDGIYGAQIVTERVSPMHFVIN